MEESTQRSITPISGIFILDPSGIPIFARYYQEAKDLSVELLGGFFSAIEIFVKTSLDGLLSDIGMTDSRFYFDRTSSGYIIIIIVSGDQETQIDELTIDIVKKLQTTINNCFDILDKMAEKHLMNINVLVDGLGSTMDTFILETNFEIIDIESIDEDYYSRLGSEQLSEKAMNDIIGKIKSIAD